MTLRSKTSRFVEFLEGLEGRRDRGALASLRRGLGQPPGATPEMHRYVSQWAGGEPTRWREGRALPGGRLVRTPSDELAPARIGRPDQPGCVIRPHRHRRPP